MALGDPVSYGTGRGATSIASASVTPANGELLIAWVPTRNSTAGGPALPTISDTTGRTWTQIADVQFVDASPYLRLTAFKAVANGSAMVVTAACSDSGSVLLQLNGFTGASTTLGTPASGTSTAGDPAATIAAIASGSGVIGCGWFNGAVTITPPTGFAELEEYATVAGASSMLETAWDNSSPSTTMTWTTTNTRSIAIVVEVKEEVVATGTIAATLPGLAGALAGDHAIAGSMAATVPGLTAALVGNQGATGTMAATVPGLTAALTGDHAVSGAMAATLSGLTAALAGDHAIDGPMAAVVPGLTAALAGDHGATGTADAALPSLTAAFAGDHAIDGPMAAALPGVTAELVGDHGATGTADAALPGLTATLAGDHGVEGAADAALPGITAAFAGDQATDAVLDAALPALTADFAGTHDAVAGTMAAVLGDLTAAFEGAHDIEGALAAALGGLTAEFAGEHGAEGAAAAVLPGLAAEFAGSHGDAEGTLAAVLPGLEAGLAGEHGATGTADATLPGLAAALVGTHGDVEGTMAAALGGLAAALGGTHDVAGTTAATLAGLTAALAGDHAVVASMAAALNGLAAAIAGSHGDIDATMAAALPGLTVVFVGAHGVTGVAVAVVPGLGGALVGEHPAVGVIDAQLRSLFAAFVGDGGETGVPVDPGASGIPIPPFVPRSQLYGRLFSVSVGKGGEAGVAFDDIHATFRVVKSIKPEANSIEIKAWNLAAATRTKFQALDGRIVLSAGYASSGLQVLAVGDILRAETEYPAPDVVTSVEAGDGAKVLRGARISLSYKPDIQAKTMIDQIVESLEVDGVDINFDLTASFRQGWSFVGRAQEALTRLGARFGFTWSIQNNTLQITERRGVTTRQAIVLSPETGMIGVPFPLDDTRGDAGAEKQPPGLTVRCLLNPAILPGDPIVVRSRLTPSGTYRVETVEHRGDTHGDEWVSEMEVIEHEPA